MFYKNANKKAIRAKPPGWPSLRYGATGARDPLSAAAAEGLIEADDGLVALKLGREGVELGRQQG